MIIYSNELGHLTNMATMPINGKNLKNLLIQNKETDDLETWFVALSMQELPRLLGAPVAQWVKRWPTDLADRVRSSLEVKSSQP